MHQLVYFLYLSVSIYTNYQALDAIHECVYGAFRIHLSLYKEDSRLHETLIDWCFYNILSCIVLILFCAKIDLYSLYISVPDTKMTFSCIVLTYFCEKFVL